MKRGHALAWMMRILGNLPVTWVTGLGAALGWLLAVLPLRIASARRLVLINLLAAYPDLPWREVNRLARKSLMETGRNLAEFTTVWAQPVESSWQRISEAHGIEELRAAIAAPEPVLIVSLHLSSWELMGVLLGREDEVVILYKPDENKTITELVREGRERTGCRLAPANPRGVKTTLETLRAGGTVAILADHHPGPRNPFAPFFGHPVRTPGLVAKLVQKHRPRIFFASCYREKGPRDVRIFFDAAPGMADAGDEVAILTAMNQGLEDCINRAPAQYHWPYKRFRESPQGQRNWYRHSLSILREARRNDDRAHLGLVSPGVGETVERGQ